MLDTVLKNLMLQAVDEQFRKMMHRLQRINPSDPKTIHRVRIAFKKFRYMIEIIHPLIPSYPENTFKLMRDYQSVMGNIQDIQVFLSTFEYFADRDASFDPTPVLHYYQQRRNETISAFTKDLSKFNIFWRSAPENPFPWES
jgi:CHAD domain-containing protein